MNTLPANSHLHRVFIANARKRREKLELSQAAVAEELGWSQPAYARFEHGDHKIYLDTVESIAKALKTTVFELLKPTPQKPTREKISA